VVRTGARVTAVSRKPEAEELDIRPADGGPNEHHDIDKRVVATHAAQAELPALSSDRLAFAGAYHGWGFHEDGCRSGVAAARALGAAW
jgi:predicted NAD/FAD-binding protein